MESIALGRGTISLWIAGVLSVNHIIFLTFLKSGEGKQKLCGPKKVSKT